MVQTSNNESPGKILIVDDQLTNLKILTELLTQQGYLVGQLRNSKMVMASIEFSPPDLILLDIMMPKISGFEICQQLKKKEFTRDIPVIFISALKESSKILKAFSVGGVDYITKPFNNYEVLARVKTHITLRKTQQALVEARNASESANKAKSNFLAVMSHEIRTPMNAIVGLTDLTLQTDLDHYQKNNLKVIKDSAYLLMDIINDILDLSKIEAGKLVLENIDFDLYQLLDYIVNIFTAQVEKKGLSIHLEKEDHLPRYIKGDHIRLKQILFNLINNAIKFTETGSITIKAQKKDTSFISFSVIDTGIGIPENRKDAIFNSFSQVDLSTTRKYGGTGLGLTICKKLVEIMGGQINVTSKPDSGSTFNFDIKFTEGEKSKVNPETQADNWKDLKAVSQNLKILLVEDMQININIAKQFLNKMGHEAIAAMNGKEALTILSKNHFDLVLMDVEMPEMNGLEATQRIRNGEAGSKNSEIPVIAMTAHALSEFKEDCFNSGMNDFISKPVNFYELGIILKKYCSSSQDTLIKIEKKHIETSDKIVDRERAITCLDGDEELFNIVCYSFLNDLPVILNKLNESINKKDYKDIRYHAHTLKGLCGNIYANSTMNLSQQIESMAKAGDNNFEQFKSLFDKILKESEKVKEILCQSS